MNKPMNKPWLLAALLATHTAAFDFLLWGGSNMALKRNAPKED